MLLYRTQNGNFVEDSGRWFACEASWDDLVNDDQLPQQLHDLTRRASPVAPPSLDRHLLPPIGSQEVWAAGVTYYRSRTARMEESKDAGGANFYDRVYEAERPELFFKASPHRVVGSGGALHLRSDSKWIVPEPELTLAVTRNGKIIGYTIGNDLSCRDIEGENPLYLPQAKTFDRCAAIGPGLRVTDEPLAADTEIRLAIRRAGRDLFTGSARLSQMKKKLHALVQYLFRDNSFPNGCLLMTGTGIVPEDTFSLTPGDEVRIEIDSIGLLSNRVE